MSSISKRRRFQPPITTFFTPSEPSLPSSSSNVHIPAPPELPYQIQSSLLTVGMRIRKSVPEGYKTKGPLSSYASYNSTTPDATPSYRSFAELAPYCGILKTGNLAVQSTPGPLPPAQQAGLAMAVDDQPDSLPSSQESNSSTISAAVSNRNKRSLESYPDEEEDDDVEAFLPQSLGRNKRSTYPVSHTRMPDFDTLTSPASPSTRAMAVPRSRRKKFVWQGLEGQENMPYGGGGSNAGFTFDFGEADFLKERRELEEDVEMDVS